MRKSIDGMSSLRRALGPVAGLALVVGAVWLFSTAIGVLIDSFTIYAGYEIGLGRILSAVYAVIAVAMALLGIRLIRSSARR